MGRGKGHRDQSFDPLTKKLLTMIRRESPQRLKMIAATFLDLALKHTTDTAAVIFFILLAQ